MPANKTGTGNGSPSVVPQLANEGERLAALRSYHILDTAEEKDFDDLTMLASAICQTPIALVSLVDKDRQWFKSHKGLAGTETPKEYSFCAHAIASPDPIMIIGDASKDQRFATNPLVTGDPHIAFYAGVPLVDNDGFGLGSLCVIDSEVRELTKDQVDALVIIGKQVVDKLEQRRNQGRLETANQKLAVVNEELSMSEGRFRSLVSQAPVAITIYSGPDLIIEQANEYMLKLLGRTAEIIGQPVLKARPELIGHRYLDVLNGVMQLGKEHTGYAIQGPTLREGQVYNGFYNVTYKPLKDELENVTGIIVVATDVTEEILTRRREEEMSEELAAINEELRAANEELKLLAKQLAFVSNTIPQQVWTATPDGMLDFVNEQSTQFFGKHADDLTGEDWIKVVHPDDLETAGKAWGHSLSTGEPYQTEFRLLSKDGAYVWHLARALAFKEDGKIVKWFGTNTDIDGHKQLEQHKSDFISIASHELKTPITSLKATLQLLDRIKNHPSPVIMPKLIEQANRGMQKISSLVEDLLSVSRMSDGQLHLNKTTFKIGDLLNDSCSHVKTEGGYDITIEGDLEATLDADEHLIEQVVINFVNNAIKYAPKSKEIRLFVKQEAGHIKIAVQDAGPGIQADKLPHLFERYYRIDHSGRQYSGLGLGLYICAEIIKKHNGQIGVDSEIGEGSIFWFTIPV